jgi:hypothetical protein
MIVKTLGAAAAAVALPIVGAAAASAQPPASPVIVELAPINGSTAAGLATLTPTADGSLRVQIQSTGMVPNAPHIEHIHSMLGGRDASCPAPYADNNGDGYISTTEGLPFYGPAQVALTTSGDTGPRSGLAFDRFPTADANGNLSYERTIPADQLPDDLINQLSHVVVAQHGIDVDNSGGYNTDSPIGESNFAAIQGLRNVPAETTLPADCGAAPG